MIKLTGEPLYEMATVHRDSTNNVSVAVNPDSSRVGNPYFKFYNSTDYRKATKVIRILFYKIGFEIHADSKKPWLLNSEEKKLLVQCLKTRSKKYKIDGLLITVWDAAKFDWNYEYMGIDIEIDKYLNGEYDEMYKDNPSYVLSTLEMPDYTKLSF